MQWKLSNAPRERHLRDIFTKLGIDCNAPGFCDLPTFLRLEGANPRIMESYAEFVETQAYQPEYLASAAKRIELVSETVRRAVADDGRLGACVDASGMIGRMLDKLGIWNYVAKATLTVTYPSASKLPNTYFWALDTGDFVSPHAIVVAPPFGVIDVTLKYQAYRGGQARFLPKAVLAETFAPSEWSAEDLACNELRSFLQSRRVKFKDFLRRDKPNMLKVMQALPPRKIDANGTFLKYVIVAVGGTIEQLEDITGYKPGGRTAMELYQAHILPQVQ